MRPTPAFKWLLILLIPLTFTWKLVADVPPAHEVQGKIVGFLRNHDFGVTEQMLVRNVPIVRATKGDCRMVVAELSPDGSTRDLLRHVTTDLDQLFVVVRGQIYDEQPTWLTVTQNSWGKYLYKLGIARPEAPPIMVAATTSCGAKRLAWAELSGGS